MRLRLDTSDVTFKVGRSFEPRTDKEGVQRRDKETRLPLFSVQLACFDDRGVESIYVTVACENPPKLAQDQPVTVSGLEAMPWVQNGSSKVAFRATAVSALSNTKSAQSAA